MKREENQTESRQELIIRYLTGSLNKIEETGFTAWLGADKDNRKSFDELRAIWLAGKKAANPEGFDAGIAYDSFLGKIRKKHKAFGHVNKPPAIFRTLFRIAAMIAIIYSLYNIGNAILGNLYQKNNGIAYQEIQVPLGSKSTLILPDQTKVILNAGSNLKYNSDFGRESREVWLTGEAYFDVAKDMKRTFTVKTEYINIKALGTAFNVKAYPDEKTIEATLVSGLIKVEKHSPNQNKSLQDNAVVLHPNQRLTFYKETEDFITERKPQEAVASEPQKTEVSTANTPGKRLLVQKNIDVIPDVSWKDTRWVINREELEQLAVKLERRYDVTIVFKDEELKSFRFTGTLANESIEQVLRAISLTAPIKFEIEGKTVIFREDKEFKKKFKELFR